MRCICKRSSPRKRHGVWKRHGRSLIDFALRRTHGTDAALKVARASYLAGFDATSNVLAGQIYGIPISGTMAHSYVESFTDELEAFRAFAVSYPQHTVLLIDTYDTVHGARRAAVVGQEMAQRGQHLLGVRLDSGDMTALSKEVRVILDQAGLQDVQIVASGSFDEYRIDAAVRDGACIDAFGVGTKMGVAADMPYLDMAYKLVQYDGRPVMKLSTGKATLVDQKQVWRRRSTGPMPKTSLPCGTNRRSQTRRRCYRVSCELGGCSRPCLTWPRRANGIPPTEPTWPSRIGVWRWHGVSSPRERGARNLTTRGRNRLASAVSGHPCDIVLRRRSAYGSAYP